MMNPLVTVRGGPIRGREERRAGRPVQVFLGIPYAAPPVGPRRWQPPEPARPWTAPLDAGVFGPAAPQVGPPPTELPEAALAAGPTDEDCLTLNVWAPSGARDRPVLVWFHGGAFLSGSSANPSYDGARLAARHDVVVVSANYRLGALGFAPVLGHANLGLLDQVLVLEWVRDQIEVFGGDPGRVTAFGESAGGGSVLHLLASPRAGGLLQRAIVQSGATTLTPGPDGAAEVADRIRRALAPLTPLNATVDDVLAAQTTVLMEMAATTGLMPYHPSVDAVVVPAPPVEALAAASAADVDLLIGTTADELRLFLDAGAWSLDRAGLERRAGRYLHGRGVDGPGPVLAAYDGLATPTDVWAALQTDGEMWLPALAAAEAHHRAGRGRTWMYRFDWPAAPPHERLGSCHAIDIPFTFSSFDHGGWEAFVGGGEAALTLSATLQEAWVAFAATGDPSTAHLGDWPAYEPTRRSTMVLDRSPKLLTDPRGTVRRAWSTAAAAGPA